MPSLGQRGLQFGDGLVQAGERLLPPQQLRALGRREREERVRHLVQRGVLQLFLTVFDVQQNHLHRTM